MIPIKMTHELNEHNYLNVDASILQNHLFFFFPSLHVYIRSPVKFYIKKKFIGLCWGPLVSHGSSKLWHSGLIALQQVGSCFPDQG